MEAFPIGFPQISLYVEEELARKRIKVILKKRANRQYRRTDLIEIELQFLLRKYCFLRRRIELLENTEERQKIMSNLLPKGG